MLLVDRNFSLHRGSFLSIFSQTFKMLSFDGQFARQKCCCITHGHSLFLHYVWSMYVIVLCEITAGCFWQCVVLDHPYFVGVQFHPEYLTRPLKPSPPYLGLILASCGRLESYIARGCRLSPDSQYTDELELVHGVATVDISDSKMGNDQPDAALRSWLCRLMSLFICWIGLFYSCAIVWVNIIGMIISTLFPAQHKHRSCDTMWIFVHLNNEHNIFNVDYKTVTEHHPMHLSQAYNFVPIIMQYSCQCYHVTVQFLNQLCDPVCVIWHEILVFLWM